MHLKNNIWTSSVATATEKYTSTNVSEIQCEYKFTNISYYENWHSIDVSVSGVKSLLIWFDLCAYISHSIKINMTRAVVGWIAWNLSKMSRMSGLYFYCAMHKEMHSFIYLYLFINDIFMTTAHFWNFIVMCKYIFIVVFIDSIFHFYVYRFLYYIIKIFHIIFLNTFIHFF